MSRIASMANQSNRKALTSLSISGRTSSFKTASTMETESKSDFQDYCSCSFDSRKLWRETERGIYTFKVYTRKSFEGAWNAIKMKDTIEFCKPKVASSKPSMAPLCSQCGKSFKPEKMHSHMKSCLRMKSSLSKDDDLMTGNNTIKPNQQRCRNISGDPSGHKRVVRATLKTDEA
ncbi:unnamed protein product [Brassica napus]|uniref:(rape) hypothetical protein n=1 Tax=Brassica napus TaxID=3708 RepID=A0A817B159_BRANA|nr:unnamed protein product [Brassica napus]